MRTTEPLHPSYPNLVAKPSYGVREAARGLGVSRDTLRRAINSGQLESQRFGPKSIRIPAVALREFISTHTEDPHSGAHWILVQSSFRLAD